MNYTLENINYCFAKLPFPTKKYLHKPYKVLAPPTHKTTLSEVKNMLSPRCQSLFLIEFKTTEIVVDGLKMYTWEMHI